MPIRAPYYSAETLRGRAAEFLREYNPDGTTPVPIEAIVEFRFEMDIVPVPGLHRNFDIDAYITSDLQEIRVDQAVYESRQNRYRFSLAHELAHRLLHADVFSGMRFSTIEEWKQSRSLIPLDQYGYIEWHANCFAGLVLVPTPDLQIKFGEVSEKLQHNGISLGDASPAVWDIVESCLARDFEVSPDVIRRRGPADGLWSDERLG